MKNIRQCRDKCSMPKTYYFYQWRNVARVFFLNTKNIKTICNAVMKSFLTLYFFKITVHTQALYYREEICKIVFSKKREENNRMEAFLL